MRTSPDQREPEFRHLRIYAIDPMVSRASEHQTTVQIRYEQLQWRGGPPTQTFFPVSFYGDRLEVVDVDASTLSPTWLKPVDLDDATIAMQHGLEPSEADPQFHQQMVYAVAMRTLEQFDRALGRRIYFRGRRRLRLVPHAFRGGNAFYHPNMRAVLFGYFRASEDAPGENLPGQLIFTCLSHDIVAHEMAHAIVDRLRPSFNVATNPHVRAFHEGFADLVAMFQRLSYRDLVQRALQDAQGDLLRSQSLYDIAAQFGQGLGSGKALRTALDGKTKIQDVREEHALGAVLVAAIFDGFYNTYERRTADLIRIATGGTGIRQQGALHPDLINRLTTECVRTAQSVLTMCIRAFDYLPPADVTFGAFLRALVTADWELNPLDEVGLRGAIIEACRRRGIFAVEVGSLAVNALLLDMASRDNWRTYEQEFSEWVDLAITSNIEDQRLGATEDGDEEWSTEMADGQVATVRSETAPSEDEAPAAKRLRAKVLSWFSVLSPDDRERIGLLRDVDLQYTHFHATSHVTSDGQTRFGLVVQLIQLQKIVVDGKVRELPGGLTLVIDVTGRVRFVIGAGKARYGEQELERMAHATTTDAMGWHIEDSSIDPFAVDYHGMHEGRV